MELDEDLLTDAVGAIADHLVREALWGGDMCTWLGADGPGDRVSTLDPWLYAGDSGVGLFLSQAARLTGSRPTKHAARGAVRRALTTTQPAPSTSGLYEGTLGVALAAARVGVAIDDDQLLEDAHALALSFKPSATWPGADLITGAAGDILALVALAEELNQRHLLSVAGDVAARLIDAADTSVGMSWAGVNPRDPNLTGLAHGAASGILALSELFRATGGDHLLPAIDAACHFEQAHHEESRGNWVDRRRHGRRRRASAPSRFMVAWCHGAPGIALSRLSASAATHDAARLDEARIAASTTLRRLEERAVRDPRGGGDWSLCHGVGGLIDVLSECAGFDVLGPADALLAARGIAADHAKLFTASLGWPCPTTGRPAPGLMVGLAGVGFTYARLVDDQVPSALWVRPQHLVR
ncbi:lanthionine synthetase LanC family protein [Nocardioides sp. URHA0020]|uniref:lanthionine synthetase LanC family protein n=1 Tax=Nocardioides sp. URHA0020 TaxID=1380392 RepID=UPI000491F8C0|nr:lanthionine synthetase LanC family protein [Nocardioides sp. URHA0020]